MEMRTLGKGGLKVSSIGLGCMDLSEASAETLRRANVMMRLGCGR